MSSVFRRARSKTWTAKFRGRDGWTSRGGWRTRREAEAFAIEAEAAARLERARIDAGVLDSADVRRRRVEAIEIANAVEEWIASLRTTDSTARHIKEQHRAATYASRMCDIELVGEITESRMQTLAESLRAAGKSERTVALYVGALKQLRRFAIEGIRVRTSRRATGTRISRALLPDEFAAVVAAAPEARARLYRLAAFTGLRMGELGRLTPAMVDRGWLVIPGEITKNKRAAEIPLCRFVRRSLPPFPLVVPTLRTWKRDLERAGIPYRVEASLGQDGRRRPGGTADRKCLRRSFVSWLGAGGADERHQGFLARHGGEGSLRLTRDIYTESALLDLAGAIERLSDWYQARTKCAPSLSEQTGTGWQKTAIRDATA